MTVSVSIRDYRVFILVALLSVKVVSAQSLTVSVTPKEEGKRSYEIKISNQTDEIIQIRGVTTKPGTLASFKETDTNISPFIVSEMSSPCLEIEVRYAAAPLSGFTLPVDRWGSGRLQTEDCVFVFAPKQTFAFTRLLREPPMEVQVCYFDGRKPDEKTTVLWKKL